MAPHVAPTTAASPDCARQLKRPRGINSEPSDPKIGRELSYPIEVRQIERTSTLPENFAPPEYAHTSP
jgi:hypothetical protein